MRILDNWNPWKLREQVRDLKYAASDSNHAWKDQLGALSGERNEALMKFDSINVELRAAREEMDAMRDELRIRKRRMVDAVDLNGKLGELQRETYNLLAGYGVGCEVAGENKGDNSDHKLPSGTTER